jgi:uncharacterized protein (DUF427 family)
MTPAHEIKPGGTKVRASWNNTVLAESDATLLCEGNHYFPLGDVRTELLKDSATHTYCPWKGDAGYYSVEVDGRENADAAWYYAQPFEEATAIQGYVAFWHGVEVAPVG